MAYRKFSYTDYAIRAFAQGFLWACGLVILNYVCGWVR